MIFSQFVRYLFRPIPLRRKTFNFHVGIVAIVCMLVPSLLLIVGVKKKKQPVIPKNIALYSASFSEDGKRILMGGNQAEAWIYDIPSGLITQRFKPYPKGVFVTAISPDGKKALVGGRDSLMDLWDIDTGKIQVTFNTALKKKDEQVDFRTSRNLACFSPDGSRIAIKDAQGRVGIWNTEANASQEPRIVDQENSLGDIRCLAVSPDNEKLIISHMQMGELRVFSLSTGRRLGSFFHTPFCNIIAFSPDGLSIMTVGRGGDLRIWDSRTLREIQRIRKSSIVTGMTVSSDNSTLITSDLDGSIRVWNIISGQLINHCIKPNVKFDILSMKSLADSEIMGIDSIGSVWKWDYVNNRNQGIVEGFKKDSSTLIVPISLGKQEADLQGKNDAVRYLLDTPIQGILEFENSQIDLILSALEKRYRIPIKMDHQIYSTWSFDKGCTVSLVLNAVLERYYYEYLIRNNGIIHIGRPETIARIAKPTDRDTDLFSLTPLAENFLESQKFQYMYLTDLVEQLQKLADFTCVVEDDLFPLVSIKMENATPRHILDTLLHPNGLDYTVDDGWIHVNKSTVLQREKEEKEKSIQPTPVPLPDVLIRKIPGTYSVTRKPLFEVLNDLNRRIGLRAILNASAEVFVDCRLENPTVSSILDTLLPPQGLDYGILRDHSIWIDTPEALLQKTDEIVWTPIKLMAVLQSFQSRFSASRLVYSASETFIGFRSTERESEYRKQIEQYQKLIQKRISGNMTAKEQRDWARVTNENFSSLIQSASENIFGYTYSATHVYSIRGNQRREDIITSRDRPKLSKNSSLLKGFEGETFLFDGNKDYMISPSLDNPIRSGLNYSQNPYISYRFGSGLDWFIKQGSLIGYVEPQSRTFGMTFPSEPDMTRYLQYTFLDRHYGYWKECKAWDQCFISCDDFIDVDGMFVPRIVKIDDLPMIRRTLHLVDAQVGQVEFPENFFQVPTGKGIEPVQMGR